MKYPEIIEVRNTSIEIFASDEKINVSKEATIATTMAEMNASNVGFGFFIATNMTSELVFRFGNIQNVVK